MKHTRAIAFAILTGVTLVSTGCAVMRGQTDAGTYVDDRAISTAVKAKLLEDKMVGGMSINVDVLNGTVALSGFALAPALWGRPGGARAVGFRVGRSGQGGERVRIGGQGGDWESEKGAGVVGGGAQWLSQYIGNRFGSEHG